jgi:hypothetical protein
VYPASAMKHQYCWSALGPGTGLLILRFIDPQIETLVATIRAWNGDNASADLGHGTSPSNLESSLLCGISFTRKQFLNPAAHALYIGTCWRVCKVDWQLCHLLWDASMLAFSRLLHNYSIDVLVSTQCPVSEGR